MSKEVTIQITEEAAGCLAFFVGHGYYGDTLSEVIVDLTHEWCAREQKSIADLWVSGEFEALNEEAKQ